MAKALIVHTAFPSAEQAVEAARILVAERLCACAQVIPGMESIFIWEGMLRHEQEVLVLLKTCEERWPALRDRLSELHPYTTPEIAAVPIELASFEYLAWLNEITG